MKLHLICLIKIWSRYMITVDDIKAYKATVEELIEHFKKD